MHRKEIEISRNIIERFLMKVREYYKEYKKQVGISLISIGAISALIIGGIIFYQEKTNTEVTEFDTLIRKYNALDTDKKEKKIEELNKTVDELTKIIESSSWGYINENGYYKIAELYLSMEMYPEAEKYLTKFIEGSPSSYFAPHALHRLGGIKELLGNHDDAFKIYQQLESDYEESLITDNIFYDLGRIYQYKGEIFKAKDYYNKVVSQFPRSIFAEKAKKRILLLSYLKKKSKPKG